MQEIIPTPQEALGYYQKTEFDKLVGWSRVLQLMEVYPTAFTNPMRDFLDKDEDGENEEGEEQEEEGNE